MKWTDSYEHAGWTVTIPIKLIRAIGPKGAIFISQLFYWKGKQQDPNGWIYKTKCELEEETGLARKTHKKASKAASYFCKVLLLNKLNFTKGRRFDDRL
jgi:hypothetical protein